VKLGTLDFQLLFLKLLCQLCCLLFTSSHRQEDLPSAASQSSLLQNVIVVGFYLADEAIPYRTTIQGNNITLAQFKQLISKRGSYR